MADSDTVALKSVQKNGYLNRNWVQGPIPYPPSCHREINKPGVVISQWTVCLGGEQNRWWAGYLETLPCFLLNSFQMITSSRVMRHRHLNSCFHPGRQGKKLRWPNFQLPKPLPRSLSVGKHKSEFGSLLKTHEPNWIYSLSAGNFTKIMETEKNSRWTHTVHFSTGDRTIRNLVKL